MDALISILFYLDQDEVEAAKDRLYNELIQRHAFGFYAEWRGSLGEDDLSGVSVDQSTMRRTGSWLRATARYKGEEPVLVAVRLIDGSSLVRRLVR